VVKADKLDRDSSTPFKIAKREKEPTDYLAYSRHADDHTIVTDNGSLIAVIRLQGASFETLDSGDLNGMHEKLNTTLRSLSDERVEWVTHTVRTRSDAYPGGEFKSDFARAFNEAYRRRTAGEQGYINELYLTILEKPAARAADKVALKLSALFQKKEKVDQFTNVEVERLVRFNERVTETIKLLGRFSPRRLGLYEHNGLSFSEPLELFELVLMGRRRRVPLVRGHLGSALYGDRLIFGRELIEIRAHDRSHYAGIFGIREYPAATRPGQLGELLKANYQCCITQSWAPMARAIASDRMKQRSRQFLATDDDARSAGEALADAADDLASNHFVMGEHHFSLAVFGDSVRQLNDNLSSARSLLIDAGLVAVREDSANEAGWWAQLPGNGRWRTRPAMVTSRNFAALSPFHTYPSGQSDGNHWGPAIMMFQTTALSSYSFNFHVGDVGFTGVIGPTGSGKTVGLNSLLAMTEKTGARQIFIDKDRGAEIYVRASGGTYLALKNGRPTGFAPLKGGDYTPHYTSFLSRFVRQLVKADGKPLTVQEERLIDEGLIALGRLPMELRTFGELREVLGYRDAEGIGARLERWTQGGPLGWVFDNETDLVSLEGRFVGFDMTDFLDNAEVRTPIMMYMFERIDALLDQKGRLIVVIDEFWKALGDDQFAVYIENALLTWRKLNAFLIFATQNPEHALRSKIASSIIGQTPTWILFPNPRAKEEDYRGGLGLTAKEYNLIRYELSPESRQFLIKQGQDSIVVKLDLNGMDDFISVLSGRAKTVELVDELRAELGDDPKDWLPVFHEKRRGLL
jgi:type IV secretion system protein VirB4